MSSLFHYRLNLLDAEIIHYPALFDHAESAALFSELQTTINWQQDQITIYGRQIPLPRLTAWYGDAGTPYAYSGITMQPQPWTAALLHIKRQIEPLAGMEFNSVLLNFYRDGKDSVGWHSDDEPELGHNPVIGSVSLGATRRFQLRHKFDHSMKQEFALTSGSVLLMQGATQHFWQHQIPKTAKPVSARINLTFRQIANPYFSNK
jgi:alkylated DNA repair dioxygenase AlkB